MKTTSSTAAVTATTTYCVLLSYLLVTEALLPYHFSHAPYNSHSFPGHRCFGSVSRTGIASSPTVSFQVVSQGGDSSLKFRRRLFGRHSNSSVSTARQHLEVAVQQFYPDDFKSFDNEEYDDWLVQNLLDKWANAKKQDRSIESMTEALTILRRTEAAKKGDRSSDGSSRNYNLNNCIHKQQHRPHHSMIHSNRSTNNSIEFPPRNNKEPSQFFSPLTGIATLSSLAALRSNLANRSSIKEEEIQNLHSKSFTRNPANYKPSRSIVEKAFQDLDRWKKDQIAWKKGMVMSGAAGIIAMGMVQGTIEGANAMVDTAEEEGRMMRASQSSFLGGSGGSISRISHSMSNDKTGWKGALSSSSSFTPSSTIASANFVSGLSTEEENVKSYDNNRDNYGSATFSKNLNKQPVKEATTNNQNHIMESSAADPYISSQPITAANNDDEVPFTVTNTPSLTSVTTIKEHTEMTERLQTLWNAIYSTSDELENLYTELEDMEESYSTSRQASAVALAASNRPEPTISTEQNNGPMFRVWSGQSVEDIDVSLGEEGNSIKSSSLTSASASTPAPESTTQDRTEPTFRVWSTQSDTDIAVSLGEDSSNIRSSSAMTATVSTPTPEHTIQANSGPMFRVWSKQSDDDIDVSFSEEESGGNIRGSSRTTASTSTLTPESAVQQNSGPMFRVWNRQSDDDLSVSLDDTERSNIQSSSVTTATTSIPTPKPATQENIGPMFRVWSRQSDEDFSVSLSEEERSGIHSSSTTAASVSISNSEPIDQRDSGPMFRVWSSQSDDEIAVDFGEESISTRIPITATATASAPASKSSGEENSGPMFRVWSKQSNDDLVVSFENEGSSIRSSSVSTATASVPTTVTVIAQSNGPMFHEWGAQSDDDIVVKIEDENSIGSSSTVTASAAAFPSAPVDPEAEGMNGHKIRVWSSREGDDFAVRVDDNNFVPERTDEAATSMSMQAHSDNEPTPRQNFQYDGRARRGAFGTISGFESPIVTKTKEEAFVQSSTTITALEKNNNFASNRGKPSIQFGADLNNVMDVYAAIIKRDERAAKDAIGDISSEAVGFAVGMAGSAIADRTVSLRRQNTAN
ncbi:hypothetical protein ACHAXS_012427 [Conticribra weissflogii]